MIGFNTLLRDEGIDPAEVRLARHQDTRWEGRPTPYKLWTAQKSDLELYQQIQRRPVFRNAKLLASFVATPSDETLFIGLYRIGNLKIAEPGLIDTHRSAYERGCRWSQLLRDASCHRTRRLRRPLGG